MKQNEELLEKPNHMHYPACLGRKTDIDNNSVKIFIVTLAISFVMSILSLLGLRFASLSWLPKLITDNEVSIAFFQIFELIIPAAISAVGCTKYKAADVLVFIYFSFSALLSIIAKESLSDSFALIFCVIGISVSYQSYKDYKDYEQLKNTEGFPIFSRILAEKEEEKKNKFNDVYSNTSATGTMDTATAVNLADTMLRNGDTGTMPEIVAVMPRDMDYTHKRYMPNGEKTSGMLECPIRL